MSMSVAMAAVLAGLTGCVLGAEPIDGDTDPPVAVTPEDDFVLVNIVDSATGASMKDFLLCTQHSPVDCDTTDARGLARLARRDEDIDITYFGVDYYVHRATIVAESWRRGGVFVLPAVSHDNLRGALDEAGLSRDDEAGNLLVPRRDAVTPLLSPMSGSGPLTGTGDWSLFLNVATGDTDIAFDGERSCIATASPHSEATASVEVTRSLITVVPALACD